MRMGISSWNRTGIIAIFRMEAGGNWKDWECSEPFPVVYNVNHGPSQVVYSMREC